MKSSKLIYKCNKVLTPHKLKQSARCLALSTNHNAEAKLLDMKFTQSYVHFPTSLSLEGITVGEQLVRTVEKTPDAEAVIFCEDDIRLTFQQLFKKVDMFAAGLLHMGFKKGDRIGMWGPSNQEWIITQFATARIGVIMVNINPAYQVSEAEYAMTKTGLKGIVSDTMYKTQDYYKMIATICPEIENCAPGDLKSKKLPNLTTVIMRGMNNFPGSYNFDDILDMGGNKELGEVHNISKHLQFDDPINIQFTSGTTGHPKGATLSHHNIQNNINVIGRRLGFDDYTHRIACQVPLYHCFGMVGGSLAMSTFGTGLVFPCAGYDPVMTMQALQNEKCNTIYGTPTMYIDICGHPECSKYDYSSVEKGIMAGSPCPPEVIQKADETLGARISPAYGTTENSPVTFLVTNYDSDEMRLNSVGQPGPSTEVKVIDHDNNITPINVSGELCIRGYCVMLGYWDDPLKTKECITDEGWYKTGDIGVLDEGGYCRIVGRTKDMIIRGGENIYPTEIEDFLYTSGKIANAQIFGVPDKRMGEAVAAWIKIRDGCTLTEDEVRTFCKGKISHYKIPQYIKFVQDEDFPLTITRKIQKFRMTDLYANELGLYSD